MLDTLPEHVAVIDAGGDILTVNEAWRRFGLQNGSSGGATGGSANYYAACRNATGPARDEADAALRGIQAVAEGALPRFLLEYVCQTPTEMLWFTNDGEPPRPAGRRRARRPRRRLGADALQDAGLYGFSHGLR